LCGMAKFKAGKRWDRPPYIKSPTIADRAFRGRNRL
jgi:hypothetical protein